MSHAACGHAVGDDGWAHAFGTCDNAALCSSGLEAARHIRAAVAALTARPPVPRLHTANDSFLAPALAARMVAPEPQARDGHPPFFVPAGSQVWGPLVNEAFP